MVYEQKVLAEGNFAIMEGSVYVSCKEGSLADLKIAKRIIEKLIEEVEHGQPTTIVQCDLT
jgi:hypothetical protein